MTKFYDCVFAPNAATPREVIRNRQLVCDHGTSAYEALSPDAFKGWGKREIKVLLDHDPKQVAGRVTVITPHKDWWHGSFVLDGPHAARAEDWIKRCGKLSPGFDPEEMDPVFAQRISPAHYPTHWHTRARLNEISVLSPGSIAWYAGAKVTGTLESKRTVSSEVATSGGQLLVRHQVARREISRRYVGRDLVIEMSDGSADIYHGARIQS